MLRQRYQMANRAQRKEILDEFLASIMRAQEVIAELMGGLDMSVGSISNNLYRIYEYMHYRLVQANVRKDPRAIAEVVKLLHELLPAWQAAAREANARSIDLAASRPAALAVDAG